MKYPKTFHSRLVLAGAIAVLLAAGFPATLLAEPDDLPAIPESQLGEQVSRFVQLDLMLEGGVPRGSDELGLLREYSEGLDPFYSDILYDRYGARFTRPILLNLATGGVGSFLEGDYITGSVAQTTLTLGYGLMLYGGLVAPVESRDAYFTAASVSSAISIAAGIAGPIIHGIIRNNRLDEALRR